MTYEEFLRRVHVRDVICFWGALEGWDWREGGYTLLFPFESHGNEHSVEFYSRQKSNGWGWDVRYNMSSRTLEQVLEAIPEEAAITYIHDSFNSYLISPEFKHFLNIHKIGWDL